ncbi:glycerol-3-phosphate dehydrogenase, mitochondrial precursor [Cordyceps javanica]|uniref:Glycerol-3-phosphate dehydrogenase n=1 Tax=Cordyceps javanica TaxID=43265 RepID=A0A545W8T4_9HYPO|nr:glycerol-3-phosphate dehydrogenase, mitochondrial precursor [Cordyceps javanica]TQW10306.1 glycerol-3-phosphate dehydrogenase, mitochondrial precursor [Cordyceps javanica]
MSRAFSSLRKPLIGFAAVATAGSVVYASRRQNKHSFDTPLVSLQRDANGRIVPPTFPRIKSRAENLAELRRHGQPDSAEEYDLLIIGGGATGTGIALDAVTRGLKVALVERDDFSAGTSSKSTKLVHGGVRYLEKAVWNLDYAQLQLVMEALHERRTFLDIAPHLSHSLPILLPLEHWWQAPYMWIGTKTYDLLAGDQGLESSYYMSRAKALAKLPMLNPDKLVGALVYYDGQHNDSRMNVALATTASLYGATMLNHVEVTGLQKGADGKICGATVRDVLASVDPDAGFDGREFNVRAKGVINATGPFADAIERMDDPSRRPMIAPASGAHIVLPGSLCPNGMGMLDAATSDGRVVFVLPWQNYTLAGTTDNACEIERQPVAREQDVDFILGEVSKLLKPDSVLTRADVLATWSGIRPLVKDPNAKNTESLVRSHLVTVSPSNLLTCAGGKWTTYRQMAEDAVDEAIKTFNLEPHAGTLADISGAADFPAVQSTGACVTRKVVLAGSHGYSTRLRTELAEAQPLLDADVAHHLASNYGDRAWALLSTTPAGPVRLLPAHPFTDAEVRYGVRAEAACTAADLIARRTRLAFLDVDSALLALPKVIEIMAQELGWGVARQTREWQETVRFLESMGLSRDQLRVSRDEVVRGEAKALTPKQKALAVGGKLNFGVGQRETGGQ